MGALAGCSHSAPHAATVRAGTTPSSTSGSLPASTTTTTTTPTSGSLPTSRSIEMENSKPGNPDWNIPDDPRIWDRIRGFASATSVDRGGTVQLFVCTAAPSWKVQAVRMGWYGGVGGRVVWESPT